VYTIGVPPETTLVFKAAVVIVVCLLQAPKLTVRVPVPQKAGAA
jgi:hypothetical protein